MSELENSDYFDDKPLTDNLRLSEVDWIQAGQVDKLAGLGIVDVSQFYSLATIEQVRPYLAEFLDIEKIELNNIIELTASQNPQLSSFLQDRRPISANAGVRPSPAEIARARSLPRQERSRMVGKNLSWQLPPVRSQGTRGTCIAFASTAVHEFHINYGNNRNINLSEQHLYWGLKQIDEYPYCGSYLWAAARVLSEMGQCTETTWEYVSDSRCNSHGRMPDGAEAEGRNHRVNFRELNPTDISSIQNAIISNRLVAVLIPLYSSFDSDDAWDTGRITMPIPGEAELDGSPHAVCIAGFQRHQDFPGGGFFVFRNSWGERFGRNCRFSSADPPKPGYGLLPYKYIEEYGIAAYTSE
jgi:C1A family cysteine protease